MHYVDDRSNVYRRLFGIMWYCNKVGKISGNETATPTYIFPADMVASIRQRFPETDAGKRDTDPGFYRVS